MNKRVAALAIITFLCLVRDSHCADLQVFEHPRLGMSEKVDVSYINIPLAHILTPSQRHKVGSLRNKTIKLEKQSEELEQAARTTSNILERRRKNFEKAHSKMLNFQKCLKSRSRLNDLCKSLHYFRRHPQKCSQQKPCGNGRKIAHNRRNKLRLMEHTTLELADIQKDLTQVKRKSQKLQKKLASIINRNKPKPSNNPRSPAEQRKW